MTEVPSPSVPGAPELYLEPVIGWRLWRLERDGDGRLALTSPIRPHRWQPMAPSRAQCASGTCPPMRSCGCGLYAVARLEQLRDLVSGRSDLTVVGSVALWGTVVEHELGYRGQYAYPDRLRLACMPCFASGLVGTPTKVMRELGVLVGVCDAHLVSAAAQVPTVTPRELQLELLSTYGVDLLPEEVMHAFGFSTELKLGSKEEPPPEVRKPARPSPDFIVDAVRSLIKGLLFLWVIDRLLPR